MIQISPGYCLHYIQLTSFKGSPAVVDDLRSCANVGVTYLWSVIHSCASFILFQLACDALSFSLNAGIFSLDGISGRLGGSRK